MTASVILAHPIHGSFNHAIFSTICRVLARCKINVYSHDLYKENFNPVMTDEECRSMKPVDPIINRYLDEVLDSKYLVFIHPNWWGQPPAVLKGYIDRVFRPPYTFDMPPGNSGSQYFFSVRTVSA